MTILKNCEVWYCRLDPNRPNPALRPDNPTWELQIRTQDKAQRTEWKNAGIDVKPHREDKTDDESPVLYYYANLKKKSISKEKTKAQPVRVVDGIQRPLDPTTIGNGSICNVRVYPYEYVYEGKKGHSVSLQAVQVVKHIVYVPDPEESFDDCETETILPEPKGAVGNHADEDF